MEISAMHRANKARTKVFSSTDAGGVKGWAVAYQYQPET